RRNLRALWPELQILDRGSMGAESHHAASASMQKRKYATMLITIPNVLDAAQVAHARKMLLEADWVDGRVTAGHQSALAKDTMQLAEDHPVAQQLGDMILQALGQN